MWGGMVVSGVVRLGCLCVVGGVGWVVVVRVPSTWVKNVVA